MAKILLKECFHCHQLNNCILSFILKNTFAVLTPNNNFLLFHHLSNSRSALKTFSNLHYTITQRLCLWPGKVSDTLLEVVGTRLFLAGVAARRCSFVFRRTLSKVTDAAQQQKTSESTLRARAPNTDKILDPLGVCIVAKSNQSLADAGKVVQAGDVRMLHQFGKLAKMKARNFSIISWNN